MIDGEGYQLFSSPSDIQLTAVIIATGQTVRVNSYFTNNHTINRGDGTPTVALDQDRTRSYSPGTYTITLSLAGGATRWTFWHLAYADYPLVPKDGTSAHNVYVSKMPDLSDYFGLGATYVGYAFFYCFNYNGAITSFPEGSFDTSNIISL